MICTKNSDTTRCVCVYFSFATHNWRETNSLHPRCRSSIGKLTCFQRRSRGRRSAALTRYLPIHPSTAIWRACYTYLSKASSIWTRNLFYPGAGASAGRRGRVHLLETFCGQRQDGGHEVPEAAAAQEHPYDHLPRRWVAALAWVDRYKGLHFLNLVELLILSFFCVLFQACSQEHLCPYSSYIQF